ARPLSTGLLLVMAAHGGLGIGAAGSFTLDTRYGLSSGAALSGGFIVDTRSSGGLGIGYSSGFTLETRSATNADVSVSGRVTDTAGNGLYGANVQAMFFSRVYGSASTDPGG